MLCEVHSLEFTFRTNEIQADTKKNKHGQVCKCEILKNDTALSICILDAPVSEPLANIEQKLSHFLQFYRKSKIGPPLPAFFAMCTHL